MFFSFFQNFDFLGPWGSKRVKNGPERQKILSVRLHISAALHHMIVIFHWISPGVFCFFSILKLWFFGLSGGRKGKKWPKMTKSSVYCTLYFRNHISYDLHLWYICMYKRIISPGTFIFFFFFSKFWFSGLLGGVVKGKKNGPNWQKILFVLLCIWGIVHHMIVVFGLHV